MELSPRKLSLASGAIRQQTEAGSELFVRDIDELLAGVVPPVDPLEAIDRLLLYIYRHTGSAEEYVPLNLERDFPVAYATNSSEFRFLLTKSIELGYLEAEGDTDGEYRLTLNGWRRIRDLRRDEQDSRQAFVAMWFDESMQFAFWDGIKPALETTGYRPLRIDLAEHNEKIDDRIITEIRRSGLLVADFTGHRGGVYFEAGFAMGLGRPVIWTRRASDIAAAHFDTRQYNHVVWSDPEDLREKLQYRIEATLPKRAMLS